MMLRTIFVGLNFLFLCSQAFRPDPNIFSLHTVKARIRPPTTMKASESLTRQNYMQGLLLSFFAGAGLSNPQKSHALMSDEYEVTFNAKESLGLKIEDFGDKGKYRTFCDKVVRGSQAASLGVKVPALIVAINGRNVEGLPKKFVVKLIRDAQTEAMQGEGTKSIVITFRDPNKFVELLQSKESPSEESVEANASAGDGGNKDVISTNIAPESKAREAQTLSVKKMYRPEICQYGAKYGDLLEIKYAMSLDDGTFLDASGVASAGRAGDISIYFVLGQQVAGSFPKSWDLALVGSCVGEKRQIRVPPVLAYGPKGLKKRGIPPNAVIIYDVEVIGINGNNIPR